MEQTAYYTLQVAPEVLERYPGYSVLVIYARDLTNGPSTSDSEALLREAEAHCRTNLTRETLGTVPHIEAWRQAYRSFGANPKKFPCSLEALLNRVLRGQDLPAINQLVDLYNTVSLRHLLPAGGEDWRQLAGDLVLSQAQGSEPFAGMQDGQEVVVYPEVGEVIWADPAGVTCRRWNWRQCRRTQLTPETRDAYFVLDRLAPYPFSALEAAGADLLALLKQSSPQATLSSVILGARS